MAWHACAVDLKLPPCHPTAPSPLYPHNDAQAAEKAAAKAAAEKAAAKAATETAETAAAEKAAAEKAAAEEAAEERAVEKAAAEKAAEERAVEKPAAEKVAANAAALLGLLQPLEALSLDADTLRRATVAAVDYCDAQGAASVADLVERANKLIAHPQVVGPCNLVLLALWAVALRCPRAWPVWRPLVTG